MALILIAEDSPLVQDILKSLLEENGHRENGVAPFWWSV